MKLFCHACCDRRVYQLIQQVLQILLSGKTMIHFWCFEIVTYMLYKYPFSDLGYLYDRVIPCHTNIISCLFFRFISLFFLSLLFYSILISEQGFLIFCLRPILFLFTVSPSFSVLPFAITIYFFLWSLLWFFFFSSPPFTWFSLSSLFHLSFFSISSHS